MDHGIGFPPVPFHRAIGREREVGLRLKNFLAIEENALGSTNYVVRSENTLARV